LKFNLYHYNALLHTSGLLSKVGLYKSNAADP
jgi:hypothetical protein